VLAELSSTSTGTLEQANVLLNALTVGLLGILCRYKGR
jgi:hypothetical protein